MRKVIYFVTSMYLCYLLSVEIWNWIFYFDVQIFENSASLNISNSICRDEELLFVHNERFLYIKNKKSVAVALELACVITYRNGFQLLWIPAGEFV